MALTKSASDCEGPTPFPYDQRVASIQVSIRDGFEHPPAALRPIVELWDKTPGASIESIRDGVRISVPDAPPEMLRAAALGRIRAAYGEDSIERFSVT